MSAGTNHRLEFPILHFEGRGGLIPWSDHQDFVVMWHRGESLTEYIGTQLVDCTGAVFEVCQVRKLRPWPESRWKRLLDALMGDRHSVVEWELQPKGNATADDVRSMIKESRRIALAGAKKKRGRGVGYHSDEARLGRALTKVETARTVRQLVRRVEKTYYL